MTASPHRNRNRILAGFGATAMVAGLTLLIFFDPSSESFFPACPLYTTTGLACAGCGLTRATHAIIHGDLYRGIRYNILSPLVMVLLGYTWLALAGFAVRGRSLSFRLLHGKTSTVILVTLIVFSIVRNLPYYPFTLLFPPQ
jgi:hypothetical protein